MDSGYMSLGLFVFRLRSAPLESISRNSEWRYAEGGELGRLPGQQFLGMGADTLSLKGQLRPEVTGGAAELDKLRQLADQGVAQQLVDGTGKLWGSYVIESLSDERKALWADGTARAIDFTLNLKRVA